MSSKPTHDYLQLSRKDRRAILFLLLIIIVIVSAPIIYPLLVSKKSIMLPADSTMTALTARSERIPGKGPPEYSSHPRSNFYPGSGTQRSFPKTQGKLFPFDPNTLDAEGWKLLGLREKTIATILNYRNKGGVFKSAADIKKIWGLFPDEAERLVPYVVIHPTEEKFTNSDKLRSLSGTALRLMLERKPLP